MTVDSVGNLFGTTNIGGSGGNGTVFEIKAGTNTATTLYSFTGAGTDGAFPMSGVTLDAAGNLFGATENGGLDSGGTVFEITGVDVSCFMAGTNILTPNGEVAIESLKVGDIVTLSDGRTAPVSWLGVQTISLAFAEPFRVMPIRIKAGALGDATPACDLLISQDHAILIGGILVQAGAPVNDVSIVRETNLPPIFLYCHLEMADHPLILAEGVAAETFVDNVDRMAFDNWAEHEALYGNEVAIIEMDYPRACSARHIPKSIRTSLDARAKAFYGAELIIAA